jgi:hypothetical protein
MMLGVDQDRHVDRPNVRTTPLTCGSRLDSEYTHDYRADDTLLHHMRALSPHVHLAKLIP